MKVIKLKISKWLYAVVPMLLVLTLLAYPVFMSAENSGSANGSVIDEVSGGMVSASDKVSSVSAKYAWGIKRGSNGSLPEVGSKESALLEQYGGCYLGKEGEKKVYLTFDEGYENGYTGQILDTLQKTGVKAIFFVTGDYYDRSNGLVARMVNEGHEVGNHTEGHYSLPTLSSDKIKTEFETLENKFYEQFNQHMKFMRPPMGEFDEKSLQVSAEMGYTCVMWSFAYKDWIADKPSGADYAHKMVMDNLHDGAILLLHAVSPDNAEALEQIITDVQAAGYTFGDPNDLIGVSTN
ncbi:MAG: polysaccharide deacetylase family protein [Clostridia bacterium]|nr:polysaccharide deacetylase family protein [Clostridia bacterium]